MVKRYKRAKRIGVSSLLSSVVGEELFDGSGTKESAEKESFRLGGL